MHIIVQHNFGWVQLLVAWELCKPHHCGVSIATSRSREAGGGNVCSGHLLAAGLSQGLFASVPATSKPMWDQKLWENVSRSFWSVRTYRTDVIFKYHLLFQVGATFDSFLNEKPSEKLQFRSCARSCPKRTYWTPTGHRAFWLLCIPVRLSELHQGRQEDTLWYPPRSIGRNQSGCWSGPRVPLDWPKYKPRSQQRGNTSREGLLIFMSTRRAWQWRTGTDLPMADHQSSVLPDICWAPVPDLDWNDAPVETREWAIPTGRPSQHHEQRGAF